MKIAGLIMATLVAIEHIFIMIMEIFLWKSLGLKVFKMTPEIAETTATLAMNQGLYNGFLAAGILWGAYILRDKLAAQKVMLFFLGCVVVAGIFGGLTAKFSIIITQGLPALIAFCLVYLSKPQQS